MTTFVRALDNEHDWLFGSGISSYVFNNAAIAQNINTRLNSVLGNCFFDLGAGINWFYLLGTSGTTAQAALNLAITTSIINTPQVTKILQLSAGLLNNNYAVRYSVSTVYSSVTSTFVFNTSIG